RAAHRTRFGNTFSLDVFDETRWFRCLRLDCPQSSNRQGHPGGTNEGASAKRASMDAVFSVKVHSASPMGRAQLCRHILAHLPPESIDFLNHYTWLCSEPEAPFDRPCEHFRFALATLLLNEHRTHAGCSFGEEDDLERKSRHER